MPVLGSESGGWSPLQGLSSLIPDFFTHKAVGRGFPSMAMELLIGAGRHLGDTVLGPGAFHAGSLISAPGSVPEGSVCHNEKQVHKLMFSAHEHKPRYKLRPAPSQCP